MGWHGAKTYLQFTIEIGPGRTGHRLFQEYTTMMLHQQVRPFTVVEEPNLIKCHVPTFGWTKRSVRDAHQEKNWRIPTYPATTRVKESDTICKPALWSQFFFPILHRDTRCVCCCHSQFVWNLIFCQLWASKFRTEPTPESSVLLNNSNFLYMTLRQRPRWKLGKNNASNTCKGNSQSNVPLQKCANSTSLLVGTIVVIVHRIMMDAWRCIAGYVNIEEWKILGCPRPITRLALVFHVLTLWSLVTKGGKCWELRMDLHFNVGGAVPSGTDRVYWLHKIIDDVKIE